MTRNDQSEPQLTPKQEQLIELLLAGVNVTNAAKQLKIGDKTARRWLKLPHVEQAYQLAKRQSFEKALATIQQDIDKAIIGIKVLALDKETPAAVRLRGYQIWLETAMALHTDQALEQRLDYLETLMNGRTE